MSGFGQSNNTAFGSGGTSGGFGQSINMNNSTAGSAFGSSSVFGQQSTTSQSQPFGSTPATPAPTNTFGSGGSGFGTSSNTSGFGAAPALTPFGSTSTTATTGGFGTQPSGFGGAASSNTTPSFGFGQQQQQTSAFGTSSTSTSNAFGSSTIGSNTTPATSSSSSAPLAFGSSSTVAATPNPSGATPAPSVFGGAPATTTVGTTAGSNVTPSTPFGTAATSTTSTSITSTPFGGGSNQSNTTSTPFGSSAFGSSTPSSTNTGTGGGFGSSGFGTSTSTIGGTNTNNNLSASAAPFTPAATTTTSGFGMSSSTSTAFGGTSDKAVNSTSSGFGGTTNSGFGSGFGVAQPASTSTSSSTTFGGGFGTQATSSTSTSTPFGKADDNSSRNNEATSSSFPFGSRIPRKEKSKNKPSDQEGGDESKSSSTEGDAQLAALRAKIQEKKQRLLDKKKMQQEQQNSPTRTATTTDGDRNVELAAKNALRFASQQENKGLSSLLPTDLQSRAQEYDASAPITDTSNNNDANIGDDDNDLAHRNVNNAKSLIGTCASMCPDEELLRREREGDIQLLEITDPGGLHPAHWTLRDTAVKRFRRSAADFKLDIPELVRPPEVLERVCGYLEEWVMERDRQGPDKRWMQAATTNSDCPPSLDVYQFIWDRTRMIRKDFILQNYIGTGGKCDARAVRCHERIARWHTMCEHQLSHIPDFVQHQSQQNIAELGQTMKTLNLYYDDVLGRALTEPSTSSGGSDPQGCVSDIVMGKPPTDFDGSALSNDAQSSDVSQRIIGKNGTKSPTLGTAEPEMRGLYILLTMNNEGGMEVLKYSGRLCTQKPDIFYSKPVQLALTIFQAKKDHNYAKFFRLLRCPSTPYLFACIMFKYVENMRKDTLFLMSRVYGAKHKTTGEAFYDSYPLEKLVNLLCYEDESEAKEACRHYGITVKDDQVLWRHSKFREPRDPDKGHILSLKPRKMMRTIESKLNGATRLSVCRGGVSGDGATLSKTSSNKVDTEALLRDRQKAQEEMKQKLEEAKAREEAERKKQEQIKKEKLRQERIAAEKRAKEEAARKAEQERLRKEQLERERLEKERLEKERLAAEAKARKEAAERAERLRLEKEAREKKEREIAEAKRLAEEERKRKLAEEERRRRLEEEKRRREEEERRRIAAEAERRRKAEEERIRKAKEEEERRIEMAWRQKVENARKILICRLLRKQMRRHNSLQKSRNSFSKLDPTCTHYPTSDVELCRDLFFPAQTGTELVPSRTGSCDELESQMYRLATSPRQPMDLSKAVAECQSKSPSSSRQLEQSYPPIVRTSHVKLFKLAILLPERIPQFEQLCNTVQIWVESHIVLDEVSSFEFTSRGNQVVARTVVVISNEEDDSQLRDCDAALVLLPSVDETDSLHYSEAAQQLLDQNVPRMVLVLDANDGSQSFTTATERLMDTVLGGPSSSGAGLQREGVAAPNLADLDTAFQKCCEVLIQSHVDATTQSDDENNSTVGPESLVRTPLSDVGFLCLQQLIRNMDETGFFKDARQSTHETLFDVCKSALESLSHELPSAYDEIRQDCLGLPAQEFFDSGSIESYFGEGCDLPENWLECNPNIGDELNSSFQHLLEHSTLTLFVESIVDSLPGNLRQDLLIMLDNCDLSGCLSSIVTMVVTGEINLISDEQTMIYLPATALFSAIDRAAAYEAPEQVDQRADVPDYLLYGLPEIDGIVEEKENRIVEKQKDSGKAMTNSGSRTQTPEEKKGNNASKRSRNSSNDHEPNLALLQDNEVGRRKKAKRSILNEERKVVTEEERSSKSFTSYLQALLG